jgi:hypothetical protein
MVATTPLITDPSRLRPGDRVDVHSWDSVLCKGRVEAIMSKMRVVWLRDLRTGERKMFCTDEHQLRHAAEGRWD